MKLIQLPKGISQEDYNESLYNGQKDDSRCRDYGMPYGDFSDLYFQVDLPQGNLPPVLSLTFEVICDGDLNNKTPFTISGSNYLISSNSEGNYLNFQVLPIQIPAGCECFNIAVEDGTSIYTSELYCNKGDCDALLVEACYPFGSDNDFDCNGIYFGEYDFNNFQGNPDLRYRHNIYVRSKGLVNTGNPIEFTISENGATKTESKSTKLRTLFIQDIVPEYYSCLLQAVFKIGTVSVGNERLSVSQYTDTLVLACCGTHNINVTFSEECITILNCLDECVTCSTPSIIFSELPPSATYPNGAMLLTIQNVVGAIGNYSYTTDLVNYLPFVGSNPITLPYPNDQEQWNIIVRNDCGDGTFASSNIINFTTPDFNKTYCYRLLTYTIVGNPDTYQYYLQLEDNLGVPTNAVAPLNLDLEISDNGITNTESFNIPIGSSISNTALTIYSAASTACYDISQGSFVGLGTLQQPFLCNIPDCPCLNCLRIVPGAVLGEFIFSHGNCISSVINSQDIFIDWNTPISATEPTVLIPAGVGSVTVTSSFPTNQAFMLSNNLGLPLCP